MHPIVLQEGVKNLHKKLQESKRKYLVLGVSGGIDSSVALALLLHLQKQFPGFYEVIPVSCPIHGSEGTTEQAEAKDLARKLCDHFEIPLQVIPLALMSRQATRTLTNDTPYLQQQVDYWLRPMALYKVSMEHSNSILVGTINRSEWMLGWFSQYLDVLGINPLIDLYKSDVYALGKLLDVPSFITDVPPKGGLADGKTDEESLGFTYTQFEIHQAGLSVPAHIAALIEERKASSQFKRDRFNLSHFEGIFKV